MLTAQSMRKYPRTSHASSVVEALRHTSQTLPGDKFSVVSHTHRSQEGDKEIRFAMADEGDEGGSPLGGQGKAHALNIVLATCQ